VKVGVTGIHLALDAAVLLSFWHFASRPSPFGIHDN
jgi:hypothetical protein